MAGPEQKRIQSGEFNEASVKKVDEAALTDMRRFASNQTTLNARGTGADHIPLSLGERPVVDNRDLQGVPKSQEQDEQWAVEFSRDENRIVEILTSTFYTDDDQAEVIAILYRWAARRTLTVDKLAIELNLGLRSDLLDRLFYRLKREPVLGIQGRSSSFDALFKGRTNCYEILFSPSFDRADEVRAIRDTSSIDFIGRDERIDRARSEQTSEDLFAEGLFGWENNEFEFIGVDESTDAKYKAKLVINKLEETPPDCLTQIQKVICEGVRREGQNFLLRRYRVVTAGDKLRAAKALVKEVIVLILDYVLIELTAGVATAVLPKVLRMAIGATEGAGAAGGTLVSEVGVVSKAGAMEGGIGKELTATGKLESKGVALKVGSEAAPPPLFPMRPVSEIAPSKSLRNLAADTEKVATRTAPPLGKLKTPN